MQKTPKLIQSPFGIMVLLVFAVFIAQLLASGLLHFLRLSALETYLLDVVLLTALLIPVFLFLVYQPMKFHLDRLESSNKVLDRQLNFIDDALNIIRDIFIFLDKDGNLVWWNSALTEITGYNDDVLQHMRFQDFFSEDQLPAVLEHLTAAKKKGYNSLKATLATGNGQKIPFEFAAGLIADDKGGQEYIFTAARDITLWQKADRERDDVITELKDTLKKVKNLSGLVPICSMCYKIRDDEGYWQRLEIYFTEYTSAEFSHGICPDCQKKYYAEYLHNISDKKEPPPAD